jgi:cyclophilin family peptidyl-prolyl cis-trans isomerase
MKVFKTVLLIAVLILASCKPTKYADLEDGLYANMQTNKGDILLQLTFEETPMTVANFVSLAEGSNTLVTDSLKGKPFYNGIIFHRVVNNFVIQFGDPTGTGSGGPGYRFKDEFPKDNEGNLLLKHDSAGILSMANSGPATNGSQIFITHKETPHLDGKHSVFGKVVKGQSVVDSIAKGDTIKTVEVVKLGKAAKKFKADKVFADAFAKAEEEKKAKEAKINAVAAEKKAEFEAKKAQAIELPSGLKYIITSTNNGEKPVQGADVMVSAAGYFTNGKLFWSNWKEVAKKYEMYDHRQEDAGGYKPFPSVYSNEARLIQGFREGLQQLKVGDKAILYIPSHLGYGAQAQGDVIPANSDLIFEIELVEIVKNSDKKE